MERFRRQALRIIAEEKLIFSETRLEISTIVHVGRIAQEKSQKAGELLSMGFKQEQVAAKIEETEKKIEKFVDNFDRNIELVEGKLALDSQNGVDRFDRYMRSKVREALENLEEVKQKSDALQAWKKKKSPEYYESKANTIKQVCDQLEHVSGHLIVERASYLLERQKLGNAYLKEMKARMLATLQKLLPDETVSMREDVIDTTLDEGRGFSETHELKIISFHFSITSNRPQTDYFPWMWYDTNSDKFVLRDGIGNNEMHNSYHQAIIAIKNRFNRGRRQ